MNWLFGIELGLMTCWILLILVSALGTPPAMVCGCNLFRSHGLHLITRWLFVDGMIGMVLAILVVADLGWIGALPAWPLILFMSVFSLWRWWRHSRNDRKKLKDKVLGRVRNLGGRLVVEPIPAH